MKVRSSSEPAVTAGRVRSTVSFEQIVVGFVINMSGVPGRGLITTSDEAAEVQPTEFVTVNEYVPGSSPVIVREVPVPEVSTSSGYLVRVQVPDGNPLRTTLPVETVYVGWVMVPTTGAEGVGG